MAAGAEGFQGADALADAGPSAGTLLRQARERAGINILALAVSLKVPLKKLEALEADRLDLLPDAVFARALASSVCRTLKIDASLILSQLPKTGSHQLTNPEERINTPFKTPSVGYRLSVWSQISRPAILAGLVLVLGASVLWFLPLVKTILMDAGGNPRPTSARTAPGNSVAQTSPAIAAAEGREFLSTAVQASRPVGVIDGLSAPALPAAIPATLASTAQTGSSLVSSATPATSESAAVTELAAGIVVFKASAVSWVEVTDARGQVVLRRTLNAGDVASASGTLPLAAVVGRADATQVQVRGKAIDVTAFAKDNVARFEVK